MGPLIDSRSHPIPHVLLACAAAVLIAPVPIHAAEPQGDYPPRHPYVDVVSVLPQRSCGVFDPRICEGDSLAVVIEGTFPSDCYRVQSLETLPPAPGSPPATPPLVRLTVSDQGCAEIACRPGPTPWTVAITLPPLPGSDSPYWLETEVVRGLGCPPASLDTTAGSTPFMVDRLEYCRAAPCTCLTPVWPQVAHHGDCPVWITPGRTADLTLGVRSPTALGRLEGSLSVPNWSHGLRIVALQAVGSAASMRLDWEPIASGVHFVLNADRGTPIPAMPAGSAAPVLGVTVGLEPGSTDWQYTVVTEWDLRGSDALGQAVLMCQPGDREFILPPAIQLCLGEGGCDFNHDTFSDVRDLVLMTRCLTRAGPCPIDPFDCDVSEEFDLGDIVCCAREGLGATFCFDCPADSVRSAPEVALSFAASLAADDRLEVPLRIEGIERVAGARLRVRFPADRLDVAGVGVDPAWVTVHQVERDVLSIGLIRGGALTGDIGVPWAGLLDLALRFTLRPGQQQGGELAVVESDFSDGDGVKLAVAAAAPRLALAGPPSLALGAARPNPFAGETRFSVTLDQPGPLEVAIYDLAGRRLAMVFRGAATAGTQVFAWDGRRADGGAARGGVYFYRARTNEVSATGRMVMLQRR